MKEAWFPSPRAADHKELKQEIWNHQTAVLSITYITHFHTHVQFRVIKKKQQQQACTLCTVPNRASKSGGWCHFHNIQIQTFTDVQLDWRRAWPCLRRWGRGRGRPACAQRGQKAHCAARVRGQHAPVYRSALNTGKDSVGRRMWPDPVPESKE